ncbi:hypothetical protein QBZ16_001331 [Prototheca wickerhamii]|uniref:Phosphoribosyltransferase domain-containing protein n=1 Tax=Prototheca wickerhamii TaxID=3111 RepID=A0AAD9IG31_PROWI|nr:hypothetical protein QBZ16_001331 [Prototheca wickerhamii]
MGPVSRPPSVPEELDFRITAPNLEGQPIYLFYYPDCERLAERVVQASQGRIQLGRIRWGHFADTFPNVFVTDAHKIRNRHVAFLASFHNPGVILEQKGVIDTLLDQFLASFSIILPYFPTGTHERVENPGDVATASTLAGIISDVKLSRSGRSPLVIFDIHALQERFYFGQNVLPLLESGIPLLRERLKKLPDQDKITIAYPDEGAWKRFHFQFSGYEEIICTKVRDGNKRIVKLKEGNPEGKHVIIVDDLVQSGGTLIECQKLLSQHGASAVSAYVTHGVFPKESWRKFQPVEGSNDGAAFKYFWITDSCAQTCAAVEGSQPFEVLSLAEPIAAALLL